eukprot:Sdes_comp19329_c0_seq2m10493
MLAQVVMITAFCLKLKQTAQTQIFFPPIQFYRFQTSNLLSQAESKKKKNTRRKKRGETCHTPDHKNMFINHCTSILSAVLSSSTYPSCIRFNIFSAALNQNDDQRQT